jgi:hypothetical protein
MYLFFLEKVMKKLLTLIAVFALTAPVFAADGDPNVLITCEADGTTVTVGYQLLDQGTNPGLANLMRGLAIDITTSNTATIDGISDYLTGTTPADSTQIPQGGYPIFMGSIVIGPQDPNFVTDYGDPVAPNTDPDALGGLNTTGITVELGSLYPQGGTAPGTSGTLFKIAINCKEETSTVLTIAANTTRGGCVLEDGSTANIVSAGCTIECAVDCYVVGQPRYYDENMNPGPAITQANYDAWVAAGKPACWCCPHHGYGDVNGDGFINPNDVSLVNNAFLAGILPPIPPNYIRCDVNHDGFINPNDVSLVNNKFLASVPQLPNTCPDCP